MPLDHSSNGIKISENFIRESHMDSAHLPVD
jgi:hypothetical protein